MKVGVDRLLWCRPGSPLLKRKYMLAFHPKLPPRDPEPDDPDPETPSPNPDEPGPESPDIDPDQNPIPLQLNYNQVPEEAWLRGSPNPSRQPPYQSPLPVCRLRFSAHTMQHARLR